MNRVRPYQPIRVVTALPMGLFFSFTPAQARLCFPAGQSEGSVGTDTNRQYRTPLNVFYKFHIMNYAINTVDKTIKIEHLLPEDLGEQSLKVHIKSIVTHLKHRMTCAQAQGCITPGSKGSGVGPAGSATGPPIEPLFNLIIAQDWFFLPGRLFNQTYASASRSPTYWVVLLECQKQRI